MNEETSPEKKPVIPKSPKLPKIKRSAFLIKKLKPKPKIKNTLTLAVRGTPDIPYLAPIERQTPEGDDNFILTKSVSETNLQGTWKVDHLRKDSVDQSSDQSVSKVERSKGILDPEDGPPERAKSLENLKDMPAYGELIVDQAAARSNANQNSSKPKDHLYKILVIGDLGTGKTSIIKRYVHRFFTQHYRATIGVDFALKVLNWDDNTLIRLQLWDIAGK
nr:unnamed protein product [Callosobruchus analis]